jgi:AraC-like DNA-binding protein
MFMGDASNERFVEQVIAVVEKHLGEDGFGVEALARRLRMSRSSLYLKLKAASGRNPQDFIRFRRLERAARLLKDTNGKVSAIAAQVGWLEHTHFDRAFKAHFGCSPSQYRLNNN